MNVFDLRSKLVDDYSTYIKGFLKFRDARISQHVTDELAAGRLWPKPLIQLNPCFLPGASIDELVADNVLHDECSRIFRRKYDDGTSQPLRLHTHQEEAIRRGVDGKSYSLWGITSALLAAPVYAVADKIGLPAANLVAMLESVYTALTAVIVFLFVTALGYRARTAITLSLFFGLGTLAFLCILLISLFLSQAISRPITRLRDAAINVGQGRLDVHIPSESGDELGQLAHSFNHMVSSIKSAQAALRESEERYRTIFETAAVSIWEEDFTEFSCFPLISVSRISRSTLSVRKAIFNLSPKGLGLTLNIPEVTNFLVRELLLRI